MITFSILAIELIFIGRSPFRIVLTLLAVLLLLHPVVFSVSFQSDWYISFSVSLLQQVHGYGALALFSVGFC